MYLIMTICGEPFIPVEFDFTGKETEEQRTEHVSDIALILEQEYTEEIKHRGGSAEFYYQVFSRMDYMEFSDFEFKQLEFKIKAIRSLRKNLPIIQNL